MSIKRQKKRQPDLAMDDLVSTSNTAGVDEITLPLASRYHPTRKELKRPRNHAVPVLDVLVDDLNHQKLLLVLPLLREIDSPDFESIPEVLDLVGQTLEVRPIIVD